MTMRLDNITAHLSAADAERARIEREREGWRAAALTMLSIIEDARAAMLRTTRLSYLTLETHSEPPDVGTARLRLRDRYCIEREPGVHDPSRHDADDELYCDAVRIIAAPAPPSAP
jgi:hypothetical protein